MYTKWRAKDQAPKAKTNTRNRKTAAATSAQKEQRLSRAWGGKLTQTPPSFPYQNIRDPPLTARYEGAVRTSGVRDKLPHSTLKNEPLKKHVSIENVALSQTCFAQ